MGGDVEFSEVGRMKYPCGFEVMEVADAGMSPHVSVSPAAAGFTRLNLNLERRRQLGVEVGDRVLVRSWLEVMPAVAVPVAMPVTPFGGVPVRWDLAKGEWVPLQVVLQDGVPDTCDPSADVDASFTRTDMRMPHEPTVAEVRWLDALTGRFAVRLTAGAGGYRVLAFHSRFGRVQQLMDRTIEVFDSRVAATIPADVTAKLEPPGLHFFDPATGLTPPAGPNERWECVEPVAAADPEPERDGYKYGGML